MKKLIYFAIVGFLCFSSCTSVYYGSMYNNSMIDKGNFSYTGVRNGYSSCFYVLGIGGMNHSSLINEAKEKMLLEYPLRRNEALVNQVVEWKKSFYFPFFLRVTCIINADVVKFDETDPERLKE
jgi:hypothetical protein